MKESFLQFQSLNKYITNTQLDNMIVKHGTSFCGRQLLLLSRFLTFFGEFFNYYANIFVVLSETSTFFLIARQRNCKECLKSVVLFVYEFKGPAATRAK